MGIDAESQDLTARIQARRKALVLAGEVEPGRPGERLIHGRAPGAHDAFEASGVGRVAIARARRAAAETVVEMDYTDYGNGGGGGVAVQEPEAEEEEFEWPEAAAEDTAAGDVEYAERLVTSDDGALELRLAGVEAALAQLGSDLDERLDGLGKGFLALAKGLSDDLVAIRRETEATLTHIEAHRLNSELVEKTEQPKRRWYHILFGPGSGPYE